MAKNIYEQIGEKFFEVGLAEVFDIQSNDNVNATSDSRLSLLFGFLEEAAEGGLADPSNVISWEARGEQLLKTKWTR